MAEEHDGRTGAATDAAAPISPPASGASPYAASGAAADATRVRRTTLRTAVVVTGLTAAAAAYLWHTNPHRPGQALPRCPFNAMTGLLCPACGGTRMAYDLLHGDLPAAFHDNAALLVLGVPLAAYVGGRLLYEGLRGRRYRVRPTPRTLAAILATALVWGVVRNVAG
ncbi:DUF2752 domain-containing protein [Streptomyces niger]|uniref:DUF2752 domain-containing protein n=1 Tax=Streptomyces niger TaxID=66373 RepID=UPI000A50DC63|nr:DUF2752 domain-containing protein [Streptomyces niger]